MKRIVLSGVESTGKSGLARWLAKTQGARVVPEFGRSYTQELDRPLTLADHIAIADGHIQMAEAEAWHRPDLLVEDTDIVMTTAWATMLFGSRDAVLAGVPSRADLHLLLLPDVPFMADPVRMFGAPADRLAFHRIVVAEFSARGLGFVPVGGSWAQRRQRAAAAIRAFGR